MKPTNREIDAVIKENAKAVLARFREDFCQDMWAALLAKGDVEKRDLNIVIFRERENWKAARGFCCRDMPIVDPTINEPTNEVTPESIVSAAETLEMKVSALVDAMKGKFSPAEVDVVIAGIRKALPWNAIAASVGRDPRAFDYYVAFAREAA